MKMLKPTIKCFSGSFFLKNWSSCIIILLLLHLLKTWLTCWYNQLQESKHKQYFHLWLHVQERKISSDNFWILIFALLCFNLVFLICITHEPNLIYTVYTRFPFSHKYWSRQCKAALDVGWQTHDCWQSCCGLAGKQATSHWSLSQWHKHTLETKHRLD